MSILVSRADMKIYVLENADIVAEGAATIKDRPSRSALMCSYGRVAMPRARPGKAWVPC